MGYALFKKSWKDIIFEKRNKEYGAYELREEYDRYILRALLIAVIFAFLSIAGPGIYKWLFPEKPFEREEMIEVDLAKLPPPPENPNEPPPPPPPKIELPKVETIKFLPPEVKKDELVNEPPPTIEEVKEAVISNKSEEGEKGGETAVVVEESAPVAIEEPKEEEVLLYAEQMPSFVGGYKEMMLFIQKNIVYPKEALNMGIEGKVYVEFIVDAHGHLSNFIVKRGIGYGCDEAAVSVMKKMPKWEPARVNGRPVKLKTSIPIVFKLG
jgi:protein TonB